jgi:hypothetical protein
MFVQTITIVVGINRHCTNPTQPLGLLLETGGAPQIRFFCILSRLLLIIDPREFSPYLSIIIPGLKMALLHPITDVRSTAAKALGALT